MNKNSVTVPIFKYDAAAIFGIVIISAVTLIFLFLLLMSGGDYILLFLPVVVFIIYIRYAKKSPFKTRIVDKNGLTLSTDGITHGSDFYPSTQIEAIAIYLYAFENFEYRDGFVSGGQVRTVYVRAHGDRNKLSFRWQGTVFDFDFYLDDYSRFCSVRNVINDWLAEGINVVLKQAFDDAFIIQEMTYYNTPTGL